MRSWREAETRKWGTLVKLREQQKPFGLREQHFFGPTLTLQMALKSEVTITIIVRVNSNYNTPAALPVRHCENHCV
jgi:hypothetical protein